MGTGHCKEGRKGEKEERERKKTRKKRKGGDRKQLRVNLST